VAGVIRIAAIDNDRLVPAGLRALLSGQPDIALVHASGSVAQHCTQTVHTDVVLLDLMLEDGSTPAENVAALCRTGARVLVLSVHGERRHVRATLRAGAGGYLVKDDDAEKLADAIRAVHAGRLALTTDLMSLINDDPPALSPQEHQALFLYGTGSTLVATARRMGVAVPTVRSYLERIRAKWAAADEPVDDVRTLIDEYPPRPGPPTAHRPPPQAPERPGTKKTDAPEEAAP
jgi:DNA-binding NarL/FixJ family response regulator